MKIHCVHSVDPYQLASDDLDRHCFSKEGKSYVHNAHIRLNTIICFGHSYIKDVPLEAKIQCNILFLHKNICYGASNS